MIYFVNDPLESLRKDLLVCVHFLPYVTVILFLFSPKDPCHLLCVGWVLGEWGRFSRAGFFSAHCVYSNVRFFSLHKVIFYCSIFVPQMRFFLLRDFNYYSYLFTLERALVHNLLCFSPDLLTLLWSLVWWGWNGVFFKLTCFLLQVFCFRDGVFFGVVVLFL